MAQGRPRDAGEILVEGWLAFVRAACVKWIDSQNVSRDDLTEVCLRAFDCALDIPSPTTRLHAQSATLAEVPRATVGDDTTRLAALSTARSVFTNRNVRDQTP